MNTQHFFPAFSDHPIATCRAVRDQIPPAATSVIGWRLPNASAFVSTNADWIVIQKCKKEFFSTVYGSWCTHYKFDVHCYLSDEAIYFLQ